MVDADGNIVDEWTSGKEAHVIRELTVGKEYTLVETKPADGYVTAESVKFTIKDTADVQKVEMKDDVTKVKISKQDIAGKELPGERNSQSLIRMEKLWKAGPVQRKHITSKCFRSENTLSVKKRHRMAIWLQKMWNSK